MYIKKILLAIALLGLAAFAFFAYYVYNAMFKPNTAFTTPEVHLYIKPNSNYETVQKQLKPLLIDMDGFNALAARKKYVHNVKSGHYLLKKGMTNNDIINTIRSKNLPIKLSFNNQETLYHLAGRIAEQISADSTALVNAMTNKAFLNKNGFTRQEALAMYIPNSYEFFWDTTAESFRDRMLTEHKKFWNTSRLKKAKAQNLTPAQVVTLASIVHKETVKTDERPRVAGVYLNRLKKKIPLQADPTVIYAVKKKANNFNKVIKRVLYKDLEVDSPYNTYKNRELPPGPIVSPDVSAIKAVLNPEKHGYYYFVADVERFGYHKFAKTLAQHNRNRKDYVKWISSKGINR